MWHSVPPYGSKSDLETHIGEGFRGNCAWSRLCHLPTQYWMVMQLAAFRSRFGNSWSTRQGLLAFATNLFIGLKRGRSGAASAPTAMRETPLEELSIRNR